MIVQIYSLTNVEDVRAMVELGVDNLGFAAGEADVPAGVSISEARELFDLVPSDRATVALTVKTDVDAIVEKAETLRPDVLHLCPEPGALSVADVGAIHDRTPAGVDLMQAIEVDGPAAVDRAQRYDDVSDSLILDTATTDVPGVGASGETHDWSISREVVEATDAPVILAGGLSPDNVAEAVRAVRPAGVDSYTRTSRTERRKDHEAVEAFVDRARRAARERNGD
jgi:phosphoribosylanthranilate isomerase